MFKSATFAALTLLATLSAANAAIKGVAPDASSANEVLHQTAGIPKPKLPPRNPFGPKSTASEMGTERLQLACQTGNIKNKCKPDLTKLPGRGRA